VKLMGRSSGYIAMYATLASHDVDICLIPEVSFILEGSCVC
jgi:6-phosphofructokinase 1